jgi:hypothetical protein
VYIVGHFYYTSKDFPQVYDNLHVGYFTVMEDSTNLTVILRTLLATGTEIIVDVLRHVAV